MSIVFGGCTSNPKKVAYEGEDLTNLAEITRDKQTKAASIMIKEAGEWKLFSGSSVDKINLSSPLAQL